MEKMEELFDVLWALMGYQRCEVGTRRVHLDADRIARGWVTGTDPEKATIGGVWISATTAEQDKVIDYYVNG